MVRLGVWRRMTLQESEESRCQESNRAGKKGGSGNRNGQEITGEFGRGVGREQRRQNDENAQGHTLFGQGRIQQVSPGDGNGEMACDVIPKQVDELFLFSFLKKAVRCSH